MKILRLISAIVLLLYVGKLEAQQATNLKTYGSIGGYQIEYGSRNYLDNIADTGSLTLRVPEERIRIMGQSANRYISFTTASNTAANRGILNFVRARSTLSAQTQPLVGDIAGSILFSVWGGSSLINSTLIQATVDGTVSTTTGPMAVSIFTTATGPSSVERFRVTSGGNISAGTVITNPSYILHITTPSTSGFAVQNTSAVSNTSGAFIRAYQSGTPVLDDRIGAILVGGNPSGTTFRSGFLMEFRAAQNWVDGTQHGTYGVISTTSIGAASPTEKIRISAAGNLGMGVTAPTATIHLKAGTTTASTAPLKFTSGTNLTTPESGAVEFDGTNYFVTSGSTRYTLSKLLTGNGTLDFPSTPAGTSSDLTISVTGAALGDPVSLGAASTSVVPNSAFTAWVSSAGIVTVRFNNYDASAQDPVSGSFKVSVVKF